MSYTTALWLHEATAAMRHLPTCHDVAWVDERLGDCGAAQARIAQWQRGT